MIRIYSMSDDSMMLLNIENVDTYQLVNDFFNRNFAADHSDLQSCIRKMFEKGTYQWDMVYHGYEEKWGFKDFDWNQFDFITV